MRRAVVLLSLASGCVELGERIEHLFEDRTPRERYEAALAAAGLGGTALVRDWTAAAELALREAPLVAAAHVEGGYLPPAEPAALAYRVAARRGQEVTIEVELPGDTTALVFLEAWEALRDPAQPFRRVAAADSGERGLRFEPRRDGEFVLRAQPELLRGGRFRISVRVGPTLAFPVRGGRERDIGSTFGDPRDGGARAHHGVDIFAPRGTPVLAADSGITRRVGTNARGGNVVWLRDHRGHSLYYAHLDRHAVVEGVRVEIGDTIGFVGNTGNARSTPPHLHFGIYRRGEGPIDPWWFVHQPRVEMPRLVADTGLLGDLGRARRDGVTLRAAPSLRAPALGELPRHTAMRVLAAVGEWYRVRLPDRTTGYIASRMLEAAVLPVERAGLAQTHVVLAQPRHPVEPTHILAEVTAGDSVGVLGRFGAYLLVRTRAGLAGWVNGAASGTGPGHAPGGSR